LNISSVLGNIALFFASDCGKVYHLFIRFLNTVKPIVVKPISIVPHQEITPYLQKLGDPPILVSHPSLMTRFLNRVR